MSEILIGVSACLLGEQVRHDGGHRRNGFLLEELAPHVRFVPVCPEVGIGLGVPRESIRVARRGDRIRLLGSAGADHTDAMLRWAEAVMGIRFHSAEKAAVLAHDVETAGLLGRLVAGQRRLGPQQLARSYRELHAAAFARPATPGRQANTLMHLAGHLNGDLGSCERRELREAIEDYRLGLVPVAVPLALLSRHLRAVGTEWAHSQTYLRPYPKELGLRGVISTQRGGPRAARAERPPHPMPSISLEPDRA
jgi:uncharacterized protein YbgA (DUF1722 family)